MWFLSDFICPVPETIEIRFESRTYGSAIEARIACDLESVAANLDKLNHEAVGTVRVPGACQPLRSLHRVEESCRDRIRRAVEATRSLQDPLNERDVEDISRFDVRLH
jgi:hypothetical protein